MTNIETDRVLNVLHIPYEDITGISQTHMLYKWEVYFESLNPKFETLIEIPESHTIDIWFSEDRIPTMVTPTVPYYEHKLRPYSFYTTKIFPGYRIPPIRTTFCEIIPGTEYLGLFLHG